MQSLPPNVTGEITAEEIIPGPALVRVVYTHDLRRGNPTVEIFINFVDSDGAATAEPRTVDRVFMAALTTQLNTALKLQAEWKSKYC